MSSPAHSAVSGELPGSTALTFLVSYTTASAWAGAAETAAVAASAVVTTADRAVLRRMAAPRMVAGRPGVVAGERRHIRDAAAAPDVASAVEVVWTNCGDVVALLGRVLD